MTTTLETGQEMTQEMPQRMRQEMTQEAAPGTKTRLTGDRTGPTTGPEVTSPCAAGVDPDPFGDWDGEDDTGDDDWDDRDDGDDWGDPLPAAQLDGDVDIPDETDEADAPGDAGMSTIEYALGCVAAAALGALLYMVVTSDTVESALTAIFERALNEK